MRFFPYHYAPFASDLTHLNRLSIEFSLGKPFKPFDQLMGVLPAASAAALPEKFRFLMTDPGSPIIDFYPTSFEIDMNGKRLTWQGVAKLPFIDEDRLLVETNKLEGMLTEAEQLRNSERPDILAVEGHHPLGGSIQVLQKHQLMLKQNLRSEPLNPLISEGMNGFIELGDCKTCVQTIVSPICGLPDIVENRVLSVSYRLPNLHKHISKLSDGVAVPVKTIKEQDLRAQPLWHEQCMHQSPMERPPIPNAMAGPDLEAAAHRLIVKACPPLEQTSILERTSEGLKKKAPEVPLSSISSGTVLAGSSTSTTKKSKAKSSKKRPPTPAGPPGYERGFFQAQMVASSDLSRSSHPGGLRSSVSQVATHYFKGFSIHQCSPSMLPSTNKLSQRTGLCEIPEDRTSLNRGDQAFKLCARYVHQPPKVSRQQLPLCLQVQFFSRCRRILW
ncbi:hypothetical protein L7F22_053292 [Adiantum nelumboides]|nr:hypothetical protein [Adiantum nelumboides]